MARRHRASPDRSAARVGTRIRLLREGAGMAFGDLVSESGLGRGYVSELERGLVVPTVGTLARVAAALGMTVTDLVLDEEDVRRPIFDLLRDRPDLVEEARARLVKSMAKSEKGG